MSSSASAAPRDDDDDDDSHNENLVIIIAGPTGVGKSDVAAQLCRSRSNRGMIVSADSVQAYRGVQIGANKPTMEERQETPHFLIDVVDASEQYNAAEWQRDALSCIELLLLSSRLNDDSNAPPPAAGETDSRERELERSIAEARRQKGHSAGARIRPVVVGGTMMYLQWLVRGKPDATRPAKEAIARAHADAERFRARGDWTGAVEHVASLDPIFEARVRKLCGQDWYRLRRTMEIAYTALDKGDRGLIESLYSGERDGGLESLGYDVRCFFICPNDRMKHTSVVDQRCEEMILRGLLQETTDLQVAGELPDMAAKAIGYRQVLDYLEREDPQMGDADALDAFLNDFTTATRRYAKKQMQWFRKDKKFAFVPVNLEDTKADRVEAAANVVQELCQMSRQEYEEALLDVDAAGNVPLSHRTRQANEEQGKKMKFYQFKRYKLEKGSEAFESILSQADQCTAKLKQHVGQEVSVPSDKRQRLL